MEASCPQLRLFVGLIADDQAMDPLQTDQHALEVLESISGFSRPLPESSIVSGDPYNGIVFEGEASSLVHACKESRRVALEKGGHPPGRTRHLDTTGRDLDG